MILVGFIHTRPNTAFSQKQHHHAPPEIIIGLAISSGFARDFKREVKIQ